MGQFAVQNNGAAAWIGGYPPSLCTGNTVINNLLVQDNSAGTSIAGNTVGGSLIDQNNTAPTQIFNNTVTGNLLCQNDASIQGGGNTAKNKQGQCTGF
jgi:hypothetical protein